MEDEDADLAAAIAASLADTPRPPQRAASPVVLSSDDDDDALAKPAPRRASATPPAATRPRSKNTPPPPTEHELDAVFVQLSGGRNVITRASLTAASAAILGDGAPGGDDVSLMMALACEVGGGGIMEMGRAEFGRLAKRLLLGG